MTVTATIDGDARWGDDRTVSISAKGSGASNVVQFAPIEDFNLVIAKGASLGTAKFSITPTNDSTQTDNETITVEGKLTEVTVSSAALTLTDDDTPPSEIALSISPTSVSEGAGATEVTVTATIDGSSRWSIDQIVAISVDDSGASNVVGFAAVSDFNLTIAKGSRSGTAKFTITPTNDNVDTVNETVTISGELTGVTVDTASLTLTDDDTPPSEIALSLSPTSLSEGAGVTDVTVTATIDGSSRWSTDQIISISVDDSGATNVVGFAAVSDFNLTILKGTGSGTAKFTITPTDDNFDTGNETVTVDGELTGVTVDSASLTLTDDDTPPSEIALSLLPTSVSEGAGATDVTVTAAIDGSSRWSTDQIIVISVDDSGASNVVRFAAVSDINLTILRGAVSGTAKFSITPTDDNFVTGNETVTVGGELTGVSVSSAELTLIDDDAVPSAISLAVSPNTVSESAGTTEITVTATIAGTTRWGSDQTVSISVEESGAPNVVSFATVRDFDLTIAKGSGTGTEKFSITPTNDNIQTNNELVTISGKLNQVDVSSAVLTLTNDDQETNVPTISITSDSIVIEGSTAIYTLSAIPVPVAPVTVNLAVRESSDFGFVDPDRLGADSLTMPTSGSANYSLETRNNSVDEANGVLTVEIGSGNGYILATVRDASATIIDDDATSVSISRAGSASISEDGGTEQITVTLGRNLLGGEIITVPLSVSGTNITSSDYQLSLSDVENRNAGVTWMTIAPHSAVQPAVLFTGSEIEEVRTATLRLTAIDNDDDHLSETLQIDFGSGSRSVSSNLDSLSGIGTEGTVVEGSVSVEIIDPFILPPPGEDIGDSREQAELVDAESATGSAIEEAGDVDYFKFITAERGTIKITSKGDADTICTLENAVGDIIESVNSENGRCLIESFQEQGAYWVSVRGQTSESTGAFTIRIDIEYEDVSDDRDNPHEMTINSTFASRIGNDNDEDYYAITLEGEIQGTLRIYTLGITDTVGCVFEDQSSQEKKVWRCDDDSGHDRNFLLDIDVSESYRHLIRVQGHSDSVGRYVLVVEYHADEEDKTELIENSVRISSTADNWIFRVAATLQNTVTDVYQVRISRASQFTSHTTGDVDTRIRLLSQLELEDEKLNATDAGDHSRFKIERALTAGTYYVYVQGAIGTETGSYRLHLELQPLNSVEVKSVL